MNSIGSGGDGSPAARQQSHHPEGGAVFGRLGGSANGTWLCLTDYRLRYLKQPSEEVPLRNGQAIKISDTILSVNWGVANSINNFKQSPFNRR